MRLSKSTLQYYLIIGCIGLIVSAQLPCIVYGDPFWQAAKDYSSSMAKLVGSQGVGITSRKNGLKTIFEARFGNDEPLMDSSAVLELFSKAGLYREASLVCNINSPR